MPSIQFSQILYLRFTNYGIIKDQDSTFAA